MGGTDDILGIKMKRLAPLLLFVCAAATFFARSNPVLLISEPTRNVSSGGASQPDPKAQAKILARYDKLPLSFEANQGQTDARVKFLSRGQGYTLFLTGDEAVLTLKKSGGKREIRNSKLGTRQSRQLQRTADNGPRTTDVFRMKLVGASPNASVAGADELPGKSNYLIGDDPKEWQTNVPTFSRVKYENVYPGIDLVYYGNQRQLEYDFIVAPGADPSRIAFDVRGATRIRRDEHGDLVFKVGEDEIRWHKPAVYQEEDGTRQEIAARYTITATNRVGLELAKYDASRPLYIDPLIYSTYLGGNATDAGTGIAVDSTGNAYVTGYAGSNNFPTVNPSQPANGGQTDVFVAKLNPTGSALVYSTYLGGSNSDAGTGITVDGAGSAYVTGSTKSTDFPVTPGVFQTTCFGASLGYCSEFGDAFVAKLNPSGSALVYSTYLGGTNSDAGTGIAVDSAGNAHVVGTTSSTDFPTTPGAFDRTEGSNFWAFVATINPSGSALVYSTFLNGSENSSGGGIAVDSTGNAYVTGFAGGASDFPTTPGAFQRVCGDPQCSNGDAFVTKLNPSGSALVYSTYLGGNATDAGAGIAVDSAGNAYVTGFTQSTDFPTTPGAFQTTGVGAFVAKLNPTGSALVYSTFLGGNDLDEGTGIAVDSAGNGYVTGYAGSNNFPTVNPLQPAYGGGNFDAFVAKLNPTGSSLVFSTYLGGSGQDKGFGITVDGAGSAYVTGFTQSTDFRTTPGAFQTVCGDPQCANGDVFVAKITAAITLTPSTLTFGNQIVGTTSTQQISTLTNTNNGTLTISSISVTGANIGDFAAESNNCGTSVPANGSCTISVTFTPTAAGTRTAAVTVTDGAPDSPQTLSLTGVGTPPIVTLSPPSLSFGPQPVGTTSAPQIVQLSTNGTLSIASITTSTEFPQTNNCGSSVAAGKSCTLNVTFKPTTTGTRTGALKIADSALGSPQTVSLSGTGILEVKLSPASLNFSTQLAGTTSAAKKVTLTNAGSGALTISSIATSGDYAQTNNCGSSVAAGKSCTLNVTFKPTATGTRTGAVRVTDNAPKSPQTLGLTGTGTVVKLSPASLPFGVVLINTTSGSQAMTLTNTGTVSLHISSISITGTDPGDFGQTHTCGSSLAARASCTITVTFKPKAIGSRSAALSISDDGGGSPQTVSLSGTGTVVSLSATSLTFGGQKVGTVSPEKTVILTNVGSTALHISGIAVSGADPGDFIETNSCDGSVAAKAKCVIAVQFAPTATGSRTATVSISDNGGASPQKISLSGTGT